MYEELIKDLRENHDKYFARDMEAADAIEELINGSEKVIMDYCKKRNLVLITHESFEILKAYYNRGMMPL